MTVKFTNGRDHEIIEAHKVLIETQDSGLIEVNVYHEDGELEAVRVVGDAEKFTRAYVMDTGKTIEVVRQQYND